MAMEETSETKGVYEVEMSETRPKLSTGLVTPWSLMFKCPFCVAKLGIETWHVLYKLRVSETKKGFFIYRGVNSSCDTRKKDMIHSGV